MASVPDIMGMEFMDQLLIQKGNSIAGVKVLGIYLKS